MEDSSAAVAAVVVAALGVASSSNVVDCGVDNVSSLTVSAFGLVKGVSANSVVGVVVDATGVAVVSKTKAGLLGLAVVSVATRAGEGVVSLDGLRMSEGSEDSTNPNSSSSKRACRRFMRSALSPSVERPLFWRASRSSETI